MADYNRLRELCEELKGMLEPDSGDSPIPTYCSSQELLRNATELKLWLAVRDMLREL